MATRIVTQQGQLRRLFPDMFLGCASLLPHSATSQIRDQKKPARKARAGFLGCRNPGVQSNARCSALHLSALEKTPETAFETAPEDQPR
jgi:hypothetical protein